MLVRRALAAAGLCSSRRRPRRRLTSRRTTRGPRAPAGQAGRTPSHASSRELRARLAAQPDDLDAAVSLARRYFRLAMAEGDPRFIGYAEAALGRWWGERAAAARRARAARAAAAVSPRIRCRARGSRRTPRALEPSDPRCGSGAPRSSSCRPTSRRRRAPAKRCATRASGYDWVGCKTTRGWRDGRRPPAPTRALRDRARSARREGAEREAMDADPPRRDCAPPRRQPARGAALQGGARARPRTTSTCSPRTPTSCSTAAAAPKSSRCSADWTRSDALLLRLALAEKALGAPTLDEHVRTLRARFDAAARARRQAAPAGGGALRARIWPATPRAALALARENWNVQREPRDARVLLEAALAASDRRPRGRRSTGSRDPATRIRACAGWRRDSRQRGVEARRAPCSPSRLPRRWRTSRATATSRSRSTARGSKASGTSRCAISTIAVGLDADGDGAITWGELRARHAEIAAYALARLALRADAAPCPARVTEHLVDHHSDGAYAVLRFARAARTRAPSARDRLRAVLRPRPAAPRAAASRARSARRAPAIFGPERGRQALRAWRAVAARQFVDYGREGVWHIWIGFDHILFLLSLLLPAVLPRTDGRWAAGRGVRARRSGTCSGS